MQEPMLEDSSVGRSTIDRASVAWRRATVRKSAVGMVLLALAGAVLTPLAAQQQPGQEPEAGTRAREALLELPSDVVFIDSKTFDRQLRRLMQAEPETIAVDFALEPSPNELPERLDEWLHAVEKHGGLGRDPTLRAHAWPDQRARLPGARGAPSGPAVVAL